MTEMLDDSSGEMMCRKGSDLGDKKCAKKYNNSDSGKRETIGYNDGNIKMYQSYDLLQLVTIESDDGEIMKLLTNESEEEKMASKAAVEYENKKNSKYIMIENNSRTRCDRIKLFYFQT